MSSAFSRRRRFLIASIALAAAALLFRDQFAEALVIRGDDYMYRGQSAQALERYQRALAIAPDSEAAEDHYVFVSMQEQTAKSLADAISAASQFLKASPDDSVILADRALCYLRARRYALARADFLRAARAAHSSKYALFARLAARAEQNS